ncbi:MAG: MBL fold metallo-hydrolase, partial [Myxococcota bacterium]|nr:MBL fold metallo-hydrolase [Myxococcota bacterium]
MNHACIRVSYGSESLLCDPWFSGRVFNDSWGLLEETDVDTLELDRVRHIWISHEHPDHLHFPTLRALRERLSGEVTVYFRKQKRPHVRNALEGLGFRFVALTAGEVCRVGPDFSITPFESEDDCALVIEAGDRIILNQNDCRLSEADCRKIKKRFP